VAVADTTVHTIQAAIHIIPAVHLTVHQADRIRIIQADHAIPAAVAAVAQASLPCPLFYFSLLRISLMKSWASVLFSRSRDRR
jgi:hypothetical protein